MRASLGALALACVSGCANLKVESSGFLERFEQLERDSSKEVAFIPDDVRWWQTPDSAWRENAKVFVAPVEWRPINRRAQEVSAENAAELCRRFRRKLGEQLGRDRVVLEQPADDALTVRAAITQVETSNVPVNILAVILVVPVDMGGIGGELEVLAPHSGERVLAMAAIREGTPLLLIECFTTFGHARHGLDKWAGLLRRALAPKEPKR